MYSNTVCKVNRNTTSLLSVPCIRWTLACCLALFTCAVIGAAQTTGDKIVIPLSDPSRPAVVKAGLIMGSITVKAYEGKDVIVDAHGHGESETEKPTKNGMRRIPMNGSGITAEEENNVVRIETESYRHAVDLVIQVPAKTSLKLSALNDGNITVNGVDGDIEVTNNNGRITLTNISGSVVAHALNDKIVVTFREINPGKAMSFSSMNGDIDVTFPADLKATLNIRNDQGEVYSDFDVQLQVQKPEQSVENSREKNGKYRVRIDSHIVRGTINGGGQEIQFKNFNGNIYIHKAGGK